MTSRASPAVRGLLLLALVASLAPGATRAAAMADSSATDTSVTVPRRPAEEASELPTGAAHGWQTGVFRPDRLQHASLSFAIASGVGVVTRRPGIGAGTAIVLGFGKELLDDHVDGGDLTADAVGAALAALVVAALTRGD
jgi:hypothetical protein